MTGDAALGQLASTGVVGVLLVLAIIALVRKDKELQDEKRARIVDAEKTLGLIMSLQEKIILAVNKLSDLVEIWEKREADRERDERLQRKGLPR